MRRSRKRIWAIVSVVLVLVAGYLWYIKDDLLTRYYAMRINEELKVRSEKRIDNPYNIHAEDSCVALLRSGDLVMRTGADVISYMLCQMNQEQKKYSHCGLVMIEHGYPFVYHSIGGEDNPNEKLRRDSANFFFSPANNLGFGIARYDADSTHLSMLGKVVRRLYKEGHRFDLKFDLSTDDRLYCAEFVYKAVDEAMGDTTYIRPITRKGFTFVGVDNLYCNSHARVICQIEYK